jgi:WD40 repeat protein
VVLTHFNKSVGSLSLQTSMYSFLMRCHTAPVTSIAYSPLLSKVVSISKDNTIRIWHHVVDHAGPFQSRLQEQYEFVITGEEMVQIVCGSEGKAEDLSRVVVGGDSGKLRAINI